MIFDAGTTLATVPAIIALVNVAKRFNMPNNIAILLAIFLGVLINLMGYWFSDAGWWTATSSGILLGLGAAGLYDLTPGTVEPKRAKE